MKKLFLLRHAEAALGSMDDFTRPLTTAGTAKCKDIAFNLQAYIHEIDLILSSPALRTKQTIENVLESLNKKDLAIIYDQKLYNASEKELSSLLSEIELQFDNSPNTILLVNHNPAISNLANILGFKPGLQPGSLVCLEVDIKNWQELSPEKVVFKNFWM